jgi:hypothetical protein
LQGWLFIILGLAVLSTEYVWARRLLMKAKVKAEQAKGAMFKKKRGKAQEKDEPSGEIVATDDPA